MEKQSIIDAVGAIVRRHLDDTYKIILFGSQARGDAQETSDIDVGILGPAPVPWDTYLTIRREVETVRTLRHIDVVDLMAVRSAFREKAVQEGREITSVTT